MSFSKALSNIFKLVPHTKISLINGYIRENTDSNVDVPKEIVQLCTVSAFPVAGFAKDYLGYGLTIYWNEEENTFCEAGGADWFFVHSAFRLFVSGRKLYQHECGRLWLRYCPNGLWMVCYDAAYRENNNGEYRVFFSFVFFSFVCCV